MDEDIKKLIYSIGFLFNPNFGNMVKYSLEEYKGCSYYIVKTKNPIKDSDSYMLNKISLADGESYDTTFETSNKKEFIKHIREEFRHLLRKDIIKKLL